MFQDPHIRLVLFVQSLHLLQNLPQSILLETDTTSEPGLIEPGS